MEHSPRAQELLTGLRAAFPGLRPLEEGDLPLVFALYQRNTFFNSVALEAPPTLESCREDLAALPLAGFSRHKLFLGLFQGRSWPCWTWWRGTPGEGTLYIGLSWSWEGAVPPPGAGDPAGPGPETAAAQKAGLLPAPGVL